VSPADKEILEESGAAVVECSWARLEEVPMSRIGGRCERLRTHSFRSSLTYGSAVFGGYEPR
jgi:pre-rRNA-processing protein TSR3